jgi:hypothetical protein
MLSVIAFSWAHAQDVLSGRVYVGNVGDESTPKSGVTVRLYGSSNSGILGSQITSTTTDGTGWYSLLAPSGYEYYHIVEVDPSGYQSEGATSVDGTVISANWIEYSIVSEPLSDQTLTGNKFWDKPIGPSNNAPQAKDDYTSTQKNTPVTINVLLNDSDPDGDTITLQTKSSASHGSVTKSGNQIIYAPVAVYTGPDQFDYSISDGKGGLDSATVFIIVVESGTTPAALGDRVWHDLNQNGLQDDGEPGIANVWIDIYDLSGTPWMGTSTDGSGSFKIYNLPPGQYTLYFSLPAGYVFTVPLQGNDSSIDSDPDPNTGHTVPVMLSSGEYNQTIDAGLIQQENAEFDFGDAPDTYNTLHNSNGAYHLIDSLCMIGSLIDAETDGQPDPSALGDDQHGKADEDGLFISGNIIKTRPVEICVELRNKDSNSKNVWLAMWIDYNQNHVWDIPEEQVTAPRSVYLPPNSIVRECIHLVVHSATPAGITIARFRMYVSENNTGQFNASPSGYGGVGEVEDYQIEILSEESEFDFGDAPDPTYPTLLTSNGARHHIDPTLYLGSTVDGEADGLASSTADGDNQHNMNDEDGVNISPFIAPGQSVPITVTASGTGVINAWLDFNCDKDWEDAGEQIVAAQPVVAGTNSFTITVPAGASPGLTFARFRFSSVRELGVTGEAPDGEVEDYAIEIREPVPGSIKIIKEATPKDDTPFPFCAQMSSGFFNVFCMFLRDPSVNQWTILNPDQVIDIEEAAIPGWTLNDISITGDTDRGSMIDLTNRKVTLDFDQGEDMIITFKNEKSDTDSLDFGDAPLSYPTLQANQGARHRIGGPNLGASADGDTDGQPDTNAMGDDMDGQDDDDGILFTSTISPGQTATVSVTASQVHLYALLNGWIDFEGDGDWNDTDEQIFSDVHINQGINTLSFSVPSGAKTGKTFARFRIAEPFDQGIGYNGLANSGEVEDYAVDIGTSGTGSLTIIKEATPQDDTPFWITTSWGFMGGAAPYKDPSSNSSTMTSGPAGTYYLGESVPQGWTLKDIVITGDTDNGSTIQIGNHTADIDLDDGEHITVVFKNERTGDTGFDFGDAPIGYPDASHTLGGPWLGGPGDAPDAEPSQQNDPHAKGDDQDGNDDEDGLINANFVQGQGGELQYNFNTGPTGDLSLIVAIDWNIDGDWNDTGESFQIAAPNFYPPHSTVTHKFLFGWLPGGKTGKTFARLRIYEGSGASASVSGSGSAGEVEDFEIEIKSSGPPVPPGAMIYGAKWHDINGNRQWDANEPPLPDWTVWLDLNQNGIEDAGDAYDKTDASGQFEFSGLGAGTYIVGEKMKTGWVQTWPGGQATHTMTVDPQKPNAGIMFGNRQTDPGTGDGILKWNQPPLFDPLDTDTTAYCGWAEPSVFSESCLADNWFCHDPRPVTRIQWWGSYAEWSGLTPPDDAPPYFHLGIWSDSPKGEGHDFGHPGELIQEWFVERAKLQETAVKSHRFPEFMDKSLTCYQYTFDIPPDEQFRQEGEKNIYWLHIAAAYPETQPDHIWGWLTRERYFQEEAVRIHQPEEPHPGMDFEAGEALPSFWDLAFVLGTDEYISEFDFGDAPDQYYGSTLAKNGPLHLIDPGIHLGEQIDADFDGQAHSEAQGDDDDGLDDEDGVQIIYPLVIGGQPEFLVKASASGFLNAWVDREQDGNYYDSDDQIIQNAELGPGENVITASGYFDGIEPGQRMARFRFSTMPDLWFKGYAADGEVEDHVLMFYASEDVSFNRQDIPSVFRLSNNYPNPFNPSTVIPYDIPKKTPAKIIIYNLTGQQIKTLVNALHEPGQYRIVWHGLDDTGNAVSSGIYVVLMEAGSFRKTGKLVLIR